MHRGEKLGEGTFGIVYTAKCPNNNTQYAIKRNLAEKDTSFIGVPREVDILNKLRRHAHIVRLEQISFGEPFENGCFSPLTGNERVRQRNDNLHFVFGKAHCDLYSYIHNNGAVNFSMLKRYMVNILLGVEYIHSQKIIHRDLKPNNILIFTEDKDVFGNKNVAKICDFGLAKPYTYQGIQTPSTVTSWYRAPEITLGFPFYDYAVDIWSLGCILYEMIAKRAFIPDVPDDDQQILSTILGSLPNPLPIRSFRELVTSNKWKEISLKPSHNPRVRKTFQQQIGLTASGLKQFENQAGSMTSFCDLLTNMLKFEWCKRFTIKDCLDHPFFNNYKSLIEETRKKYTETIKLVPLSIHNCIERQWMSEVVTDIFNKRHQFIWYSDRVIFQAMHLFDRYLIAMKSTLPVKSNIVESELKGLIHDKYGAVLRFMTCVYLSIKYFSSIHCAVSFEDVVGEVVGVDYKTDSAKVIAELFEGGFIVHCLEYDIYKPTIYEAADNFGDKLTDIEIRDLIILYSSNPTFDGMTTLELYSYYRVNLKGKSIEDLFIPIVK